MVTLSSIRRTVEAQQQTDGLDSAEVLGLAGSGVDVYETLDSLPATGLTEGDEAFVKSNNRLYVSDGSGWYNITLVNRNVRWDSGGEPDVSYTIADSATPLIITARAIDSDNNNLINQAFASDSAQYMVDISNDSSIFTFTPKSADSIGASVSAGDLIDSNGDFVYTFKWSDGINFVSKAVTITYNPASAFAPEGDFYGNRAIYFGGTARGSPWIYYASIDYWDITTAGNASDFGDLNIGHRYYGGAASNNTRAIMFAGSTTETTAYGDTYAGYGTNNISYITCATPGNALDFGDLPRRTAYNGAEGDGTYAVSAGGGTLGSSNQASTDVDIAFMDYITVATTGNSSSFGNLTLARSEAEAVSNGTRMVMGPGAYSQHSSAPGGLQYNFYNVMDYITIATTGNATDFGDDVNAISGYAAAGTGSGDRGLFAGGIDYGAPSNNTSWPLASTYSWTNQIRYITVSTTGNAQDFGDMITTMNGVAGCSNAYKAHISGGRMDDPDTNYNTIQEITMATTGNAIDFGDLTAAQWSGSATSGGSA